METGVSGEFIPTAPGCPENCIECIDRPIFSGDNHQRLEHGGCCSSLGVVNDEFNRMILQKQGYNQFTKQHYNRGLMPGNSFGNSGTINFGYSYNPQSFTDSMSSCFYDRHQPLQRHNHFQYLDSSNGSYRLRNLRKRRPMGHFQENSFGHSFSGSGVSTNDYFDRSFTCSSTYGSSSNDIGMCNFKRKRSAGLSGSNCNGSKASFNSCSFNNLQSSSSRLPLSKDEKTFKLGICPSFLLTNHCIFFPNCLLSHSRNDFEDMSSISSEGKLLQDLVIPTEECKHFSVGGKCPVGLCCNFLHKMPKAEPEFQDDKPPVTPPDCISSEHDEDVFHEFFLDNIDEDINQCFDIDKVYIDDRL